MPELPEVQTIVHELNNEVVGKTISDIELRLLKMFQGDRRKVIGQEIVSVMRRAKLIVMRLSKDNLAIHLKMSGQLFYIPTGKDQTSMGEREGKFTHIIFYFSDGSRLLFNDMRQFGYVRVLSEKQLDKILNDHYGIEPVDSSFTPQKLLEILQSHPSMRLKSLLTDQTIIAGIGNIYVDEALWEAKSNPLTKASALTYVETQALHKGIKKVIKSALKYHGTSIEMYRRTTGEKGEYDKYRKAYQRTGEPCSRCQTAIKRITISGRGTYFCPRCQVRKH